MGRSRRVGAAGEITAVSVSWLYLRKYLRLASTTEQPLGKNQWEVDMLIRLCEVSLSLLVVLCQQATPFV